MSIRTVIVDDEPLARRRIRQLLEGEDDIQVIAECGDANAALATVEKESPDLMFLDVAMPDIDGFGLLQRLDPEDRPTVVFVSAHGEHALSAFEVHAADYLLKPFDRERFRSALASAREQIEVRRRDDDHEMRDFLEHLHERGERGVERLAVKTSGRVVFVDVDSIDWIDAAGNYVRLNCSGETYLLRETMKGVERRLDPSRFLRIHRSTIVNADRIREVRPQSHGEYLVVLGCGKRLTVSRARRSRITRLLA